MVILVQEGENQHTRMM